MISKAAAVLKFMFVNFGPVVVFYSVNHFSGLQVALILSTVYSIAEIAFRLWRKEKITRLFKFSVAVTLVFGFIDLLAQQSFLFQYEASVTNVFTGIFFALSVFGEKSLLQEFYEQRKTAKIVTPDLADFFRFLTCVWVVYFFAKAVVYFWAAQNMTLEQGLIFRTAIGSMSFYLMLALSIFGSRPIFRGMKGFGFFKERPQN